MFGRILRRSVPNWFGFTAGSDGDALLSAPLDGICCAAWEGYAIKESHRGGGGSAALRKSLCSGALASGLGVWRARSSRAVSLRERTNNELGRPKFHSAVRLRFTATRHHGDPADVSAGWGCV